MHDQDQSRPPSILVGHQACLPQWPCRIQTAADKFGGDIQQFTAPTGRRPGMLAEMLVESEVRIVHPDRTSASWRRPVQRLAESR